MFEIPVTVLYSGNLEARMVLLKIRLLLLDAAQCTASKKASEQTKSQCVSARDLK